MFVYSPLQLLPLTETLSCFMHLMLIIPAWSHGEMLSWGILLEAFNGQNIFLFLLRLEIM